MPYVQTREGTMAKRGDPDILRLVVIFLRAHSRMTQSQFGKECGLTQAKISSYELGDVAPSEDALRRMAKAAGIEESRVAHLRQFYELLLTRASQGGEGGLSGPKEPPPPALAPYILELQSEEPPAFSPEEARQEAEMTWTALERFPIQERARLIGMTLHAAGSWALAERICHESARRIDRSAEEALELANLAVSIAERTPGEASWRSRVQGYCWAHLADARRAAGDHPGAEEAAARARDLWRAGTSSDPLWLAGGRLAERIEGTP
jgi:transcriptional regulator with XRE-family HTH domain